MPDTNWEKYMIRRPLPTYREKLDVIEVKLAEWVKHKDYRQQSLKMSDVATALEVYKGDLSQCVNARMKMSFTAWVNMLRIEDAKSLLLQHAEMPLSAVSRMLGYSTPAVFKKNFTLLTGCSPEEWQDSIGSDKAAD